MTTVLTQCASENYDLYETDDAARDPSYSSIDWFMGNHPAEAHHANDPSHSFAQCGRLEPAGRWVTKETTYFMSIKRTSLVRRQGQSLAEMPSFYWINIKSRGHVWQTK